MLDWIKKNDEINKLIKNEISNQTWPNWADLTLDPHRVAYSTPMPAGGPHQPEHSQQVMPASLVFILV